MRGINLQWDRHLGLVPSVTTVLDHLPKEPLQSWKRLQCILATETTPRQPGEDDKVYQRRVEVVAFQSVNDAADFGTEAHDACEQHYKGRLVAPKFRQVVDGVVAEVTRLFPDVHDWVSEAYFAHPLGFGGKIDLHSPSTGIVVDFKGKDGELLEKQKLAYDQNFQLAGYQRGKRLPQAPCANVFFSRTHPGIARGHVWSIEDIDYGWEVFQAALATWKLLKKYDPSF